MASTSSSVFVFTANSLTGKTSAASTSHFQSLSKGVPPCAQAGSLLTPEDLRRSSDILALLAMVPGRRTTLAEFEDIGVDISFDEEEDVPDLDYFDVSSSVQSEVRAGDSLEKRMSRWVKFDDLDEKKQYRLRSDKENPLLALDSWNLEKFNLRKLVEEPAIYGHYNQYMDEEEVPDLNPIPTKSLDANNRWSPVLPGHGAGLVQESALEEADHFGEHTLFTASLFDEDLNSLVHNTIMSNQLQSVWPLPCSSPAGITGDLQQNLQAFRFTSHMSSSSSSSENFTTSPEKQEILGLAVASNASATPTVCLAIGQQASAAEMPSDSTNERACFAEGPDCLSIPKIGCIYDAFPGFIDMQYNPTPDASGEVKKKSAEAKKDDNVVESGSEASHVTKPAGSQADIKTSTSLQITVAITLKAEPDRTSNKLHLVVVGAVSSALAPAPATSQSVVSPRQCPEDFDPGGPTASKGRKVPEKACLAPGLKQDVILSRTSNDATAHAEGAGRSNPAAVKVGQKQRQSAIYGVSEANLINCKFKECFTRTRKMQQQLSALKEFTRSERIREGSLELNWAFYKQYGTYSSCRPQKISKMKNFLYWRGRKNFHFKEIGMPFQEGLS